MCFYGALFMHAENNDLDFKTLGMFDLAGTLVLLKSVHEFSRNTVSVAFLFVLI